MVEGVQQGPVLVGTFFRGLAPPHDAPRGQKASPGYAAPVRNRLDQSLQCYQEGQKGLLGLSGLQS